jgi:hypothetical protein
MIDFEEIVFPIDEIRQIKPHDFRGFNFTKLITIYEAEYIVRLSVDRVIKRIESKR